MVRATINGKREKCNSSFGRLCSNNNFAKVFRGHLSYLNVTAGMYITQKCGVTNAVRVKCDYIIYIIFRIHYENAYSSIV